MQSWHLKEKPLRQEPRDRIKDISKATQKNNARKLKQIYLANIIFLTNVDIDIEKLIRELMIATINKLQKAN